MALITFTSMFGSGGEGIAQKVSDQLGIQLFDDRKQQERALAMGVSDKDLAGLDVQAPGFFDRLFSNKPAIYLDLLGSVVYDIASTGEGLIVGHGAQLFLKDFNCALHVMVYASEESRSEMLAQDQEIDKAAALRLIHRMDKRYKDFVQYAFNRDWSDPGHYDMVINLDKLSTDWAVKLIVELAKSEEIKTCSLQALEQMETSSLQRKVDAAIIKNNVSSTFRHIFVDVLDIESVHLTGSTFSESDRKRVIEVVKSVPGVSKVTSDIIVPPYVSE